MKHSTWSFLTVYWVETKGSVLLVRLAIILCPIKGSSAKAFHSLKLSTANPGLCHSQFKMNVRWTRPVYPSGPSRSFTDLNVGNLRFSFMRNALRLILPTYFCLPSGRGYSEDIYFCTHFSNALLPGECMTKTHCDIMADEHNIKHAEKPLHSSAYICPRHRQYRDHRSMTELISLKWDE